jgi:4-hydroxy-3-polyprenylbenzoate decarboxylase
MEEQRLTVAVSGSTGAVYGVRLLEVVRGHFPRVETHLVLTRAAGITIEYELARSPESVEKLASVVHAEENLGAPIASGTFITQGMIVAPCSIKTLSAIANSYTDSLVARAADVCLKERRRLALIVRETPLHLNHLRLMQEATEAGAIIVPPSPAFYHRPRTIDDVVNHTIVKTLDLFGLHAEGLIERWTGL